jgi:hypothetical protein
MPGCRSSSVENGGDVKCAVMPPSRRISACIACGCGRFTVIESSCAKWRAPSCRLATICSTTADSDVRMPGTAIRSDGVKSRSATRPGRFAFSDSDVVDRPLMPITSTFGIRVRAPTAR